jgi:hypothetical protein
MNLKRSVWLQSSSLPVLQKIVNFRFFGFDEIISCITGGYRVSTGFTPEKNTLPE